MSMCWSVQRVGPWVIMSSCSFKHVTVRTSRASTHGIHMSLLLPSLHYRVMASLISTSCSTNKARGWSVATTSCFIINPNIHRAARQFYRSLPQCIEQLIEQLKPALKTHPPSTPLPPPILPIDSTPEGLTLDLGQLCQHLLIVVINAKSSTASFRLPTPRHFTQTARNGYKAFLGETPSILKAIFQSIDFAWRSSYNKTLLSVSNLKQFDDTWR